MTLRFTLLVLLVIAEHFYIAWLKMARVSSKKAVVSAV